MPYRIKEKANEWARKNYIKNRERILKRTKQYYKKNREKIREQQKKHRKNNYESVMNSELKNKHDISYKDWLKMWEAQNGKCAICGKPFDKQSNAFVDHNHKTGEIRGLLCRKCNLGISYFDDNPVLMSKAIEYVSKIPSYRGI